MSNEEKKAGGRGVGGGRISPLNLLTTTIHAPRRGLYTCGTLCPGKGHGVPLFVCIKFNQIINNIMNRIKRLLTLLLLVCGMTTGAWASSIPGALSGRFTINASGEKVLFSQGNLQYVGTWQFAENQWDCFSTSQYNDHRDLFGWGTGDAPNKVSTNNGDYGTFTDWGTNAITNGGNKANVWRTLTKDEWVYLFYSRENAATLFGFGSVNGMNGLIILPDNWTTPEGASFTASTTLGLTNQGSYYYNGNDDNYYHNTYTAEQWAVMESAGAVFLPAAAYRHGVDSNIQYTYQGGFYWSSTPYDSDKAYYLNFYYHSLDPQFKEMRYGGRPVRLVRSSLEKDGEGNYLLGSVDDWQLFAALVNDGNTTANAKMTADIDLGTQITMIASDFDHPYQGTFDGQGHTLTVNWTTNGEDRIAPFRYAEGATIKRLHVDGSISKTDAYGRCPASILACSIGSATTTITECWSSVSLYAFDTIGGLFSVACDNSTTNIVDCVFSGMISASNSTGCSGGFASHADTEYIYTTKGAPTVNITRGLNLGTFTGANPYLSYTFIRMGNPVFGTHSINSCYYKNVYGNAQGTQATSAELADGTISTALQNGRAEEIWVQDPLTNQPMLKIFAGKYTVPASGLGTFSAKAKFALPEGLEAYYCKNYDASAGTISAVAIDGVVPAETGVLLKGEPGETYTLTTSNETPAMVTDNALVAVTEQTTIQQTDGDYTNFGLSGGTFKKVNTAGGTVGANRAYLHILTSALTSEALARGISLAWDDDATMIEDLTIDGKRNADGCYDLQGRRVENPTKGLYIVNGKKVIIK